MSTPRTPQSRILEARGPSAGAVEGALLSPLDRVLTIFADIQPGEGRAGFAMLGSVFLLLTSIYFLKPARDGLLAVSGVSGLSDMELKAYSSFGQSLLLLAVIPIYARFSTRLTRSQLAHALTWFFVSNLVLFWALKPGMVVGHIPYLGLVFYLWFGVFNLLSIVQFWSFAADLYTEETGNRLFPAIAVGATAGSAAGSWLAQWLLHFGIVSTYSLLLAAAVALIGSLALLRFAERTGAVPRASEVFSPEPEPSQRGAFRLVLDNRYLLATAVVVLLTNWVKTNSDNLLFGIVQEVVSGEAQARGIATSVGLDRFTADQTTAFYANFFFWVNGIALVLQGLAASRLLKYGGFAALFLALPLVTVVSYPLLATIPILAYFRLGKIAEDATSYSLQNTATQVLWLPTTREMKYQGKAAIDTLFVRIGDGLAALTTFVGMQLFVLPARAFFALNASLSIVWLVVAVVVVRENARLTAENETEAASASAA